LVPKKICMSAACVSDGIPSQLITENFITLSIHQVVMLCEACKSAIQAAFTQNHQKGHDPFWYLIYESVPVHSTNESFIRGVVQGCPLCRHLWRQINPGERHIPDFKNGWASVEETLDPSVLFKPTELEYHLDWLVWGETHRIWASGEPQRISDDDEEAQDLVTFLLSPSGSKGETELEIPDIKLTLSEGGGSTSSNPLLWSHWMRLCSERHEECGSSSSNDPNGRSSEFTPNRLIEVIPNEQSRALHWKLTTWERPVPQRPRYLTLSHCWGSSLHTCLTKANLSALAVASPATALPKTYQDAMSVTVSLGYRYLWIDSLCIVQDDADDWKAQSAEMGLVYQNTSCNIAAAWAKEGSQGCFNARDPAAMIAPDSVSIDAGDERILSFDVVQRWKWFGSVANAPLNLRGWVLQERYMSPRQLSFAREEVFWECRGLAASESHPDGLPAVLFLPEGTDMPLSSKPQLEYADELTLRRKWMELVEKYTTSKLSVYTDKLIAMAGLAGEARRRFGGDEYLAGMWRKDLHKQLAWYVEAYPDPKEGSHASPSRANTYLAPSWCWSSVCGKIKTDTSYYDQPDAFVVHLVEVLDTSVDARHPSGLYDFVSGSLAIRGIAMWAPIAKMDENLDEGAIRALADPIKSSAFSKGLDRELEFSIFWDEDYLNDERAMLDALLNVGRAEAVFLFVKVTWEYAARESSEDRSELCATLEGLLLVSDGQGRCARVARFLVGHESKLIEAIAERLGIESDAESFIEWLNLGDPRLEDMVQTVTII